MNADAPSGSSEHDNLLRLRLGDLLLSAGRHLLSCPVEMPSERVRILGAARSERRLEGGIMGGTGTGAFRDGEPIQTAEFKDLSLALIGTGFPHDRSNISTLVDRLGTMLRECGDIRQLAAPALDICWVADGRLNGLLDRVRSSERACQTVGDCVTWS